MLFLVVFGFASCMWFVSVFLLNYFHWVKSNQSNQINLKYSGPLLGIDLYDLYITYILYLLCILDLILVLGS